MRIRDASVKGGTPSTDLLVCFPHRAHLTVMPAKAICSPGRSSDHPCPTHRRDKSSFNRKVPQTSPSPVLWVKAKHTVAAVTSEPTSPKVTCVGQIKVKNKNGKGWKSVMHKIERSHKDGNMKKQPMLGKALGFNKDAMQFLTCLRSLKFNFRCFGNFPVGEITSDDEDDDRNEEEDDVFRDTDRGNRDGGGGNGDGEALSKLFVVLEEDTKINSEDNLEGEVPPPNALLLMRCRSAPALTWAVEADGIKCNDESESRVETIHQNLQILMEEEKKAEEEKGRKKAEEGLATASFDDTNYYRISTDIARETWILGGFREVLSKSRSWKI